VLRRSARCCPATWPGTPWPARLPARARGRGGTPRSCARASSRPARGCERARSARTRSSGRARSRAPRTAALSRAQFPRAARSPPRARGPRPPDSSAAGAAREPGARARSCPSRCRRTRNRRRFDRARALPRPWLPLSLLASRPRRGRLPCRGRRLSTGTRGPPGDPSVRDVPYACQEGRGWLQPTPGCPPRPSPRVRDSRARASTALARFP
jgi:hypothetical protein